MFFPFPLNFEQMILGVGMFFSMLLSNLMIRHTKMTYNGVRRRHDLAREDRI